MAKRKAPVGIDLLIRQDLTSPEDRSAEARRIRKHFILRTLREEGALSRMDLARLLDFNYRSTSLLVDGLVAEGLVVEDAGAIAQRRGRPPMPVRLNHDAARVVGVVVGKRETQSITMNLAGEEVSRNVLAKSFQRDGASRSAWAKKVAETVLGDGRPRTPELAGLGVAVVHGEEKVLRNEDTGLPEPNEHQAQFDLHLKAPTVVENHSRAMSLASSWFGVGRKYDNFAYINLGESPGVALVFENRVWQGGRCCAGDLSLLPQFSSPKKLLANMSDLLDLITEIAVLFDPGAIIVGGRKELENAGFEAELQAGFRKKRLPGHLGKIELRVCDVGQDALLLGSACIILNRIYHSNHVSLEKII